MAQFPTTFVIPIVCEFSGETTTTTKMDGIKNFSYYTTRTLTRFFFSYSGHPEMKIKTHLDKMTQSKKETNTKTTAR
jgi:hypothetical protein